MNHTIFWAAIVLALLPACPAREPVPPVADSGIVETDASAPTCHTWCEHARLLGCAASRPTPNGAPCEEVCENVQRSGIITWELACRSRAITCPIADECERGR